MAHVHLHGEAAVADSLPARSRTVALAVCEPLLRRRPGRHGGRVDPAADVTVGSSGSPAPAKVIRPPVIVPAAAARVVGCAVGRRRSLGAPLIDVDAADRRRVGVSGPARAVPTTDWSRPRPTVWSAVQEARPERASAQEKDTTTAASFQPNALASGVRDPEIVGFVASRFTATSTGPEEPPALPAEHEKTNSPSSATDWSSQPFESELGDSGSPTCQASVMLPVYQPSSPSGDEGETVYSIIGADGSKIE